MSKSTTRHILEASIYDKKGRLLSRAQNSYTKTHPLQYYYAKLVDDPQRIYLHAEIRAIIKCKGLPYRIKIIRKNNSGEYRLAKPCKICQRAIADAGIREIEYSNG